MINIKNNLVLAGNYKNIKNKETNEQIILNIMNDSLLVFKSRYAHSKSESNGESDYYDINDPSIKYDAKMLFYSEICVEMEKDNIPAWFNEIRNEINEVYNEIVKDNFEQIQSTRLYIEIKKRLDKIKDDENSVLFFPFPIGLESSKNIFYELINSSLESVVAYILSKYPDYKKHDNYLVYGTIYNEIVIIDLKTGEKEILSKDYISRYIKNEIVSHKIL